MSVAPLTAAAPATGPAPASAPTGPGTAAKTSAFDQVAAVLDPVMVPVAPDPAATPAVLDPAAVPVVPEAAAAPVVIAPDVAGTDVVVIGGGIIGLACAWRAAAGGLAVTVVDDALGSGASDVAAGMIAPVTEVAYGEEALLRLTIASAARWTSFAPELEAAAGESVGYRPNGTLLVGFDADDLRVIDELTTFQRELGLQVERLRSRDCRGREPMLSPHVRGGVLAHDDHSVDPRRIVVALLRAAESAGVRLHHGRVATVDHERGRVTGVTLEDGSQLAAPQVVLAAGTWAPRIGGLPASVQVPVRPVKGQLLLVRSLDGQPILHGNVRGFVRGRSVYLVPRDDGRIVVGATQEERGFDTTVTAWAVRQLLDDAAAIVPGVDELELVETRAGLRPSTPDNRPLIGRSDLDGLLLATGHHRHGVLLTPTTADGIAALLAGREPDEVLAVADPRRWTRHETETAP